MRPVLPAVLVLLSLHPTMQGPHRGGPGLAAVSAQGIGVLRISVVLADADGNATPVPRAQLLISDNPTTREPRRVRTGPDGTVEIKLPAGSYTVESDLPVTLGGRRFNWTQILDVPGGRETVLVLTAANADADADPGGPATSAAPSFADAAVILNKWRGSLAEIWTPTAHATGFVIDARGLIATNDRTLGEATDVEVEFGGAAAGAADRIKVPGRVIASERTQGVTIIWIDPATIASRPPIAPDCGGQPSPAAYQQKVVALIKPMLEPANAIPGTASHPDSQSFRVDWRLDEGSAGGPVFALDGTAIGIAVGQDDNDRERRRDAYVIPLGNACSVIAAAEPKMSGAAPPPATSLRTDEGLARTRVPGTGDPKAPRAQPPVIHAGEFDVALVTPAMIAGDQSTISPRSFFGYWMPYVSKAQALFVRVSPQFEESFWKLLARGAARTQGVALPPLLSASANFLRLRAFCGAAEVTPIHRFIVEMPIANRKPVREGLYVFALTDFGAHCKQVRFDLFSEKSPNKADSRTIDLALLARIAGTPQ